MQTKRKGDMNKPIICVFPKVEDLLRWHQNYKLPNTAIVNSYSTLNVKYLDTIQVLRSLKAAESDSNYEPI